MKNIQEVIVTLKEYTESLGMINVVNDMDEKVRVFKNNYRPSIIAETVDGCGIHETGNISIACFDENGYMCHSVLPNNEPIICKTIEEARRAIQYIELLYPHGYNN
jgi:hypothetical protein